MTNYWHKKSSNLTLNGVPFLKHVQSCDNVFDALNYLHKNTIDILFLNINMPELSGLDLLKTLEQPPHIILTTAYSEYSTQSYECNVVDYSLKPIPFQRFLKGINKLAIRKNAATTPSIPNNSKIIIEYKGSKKLLPLIFYTLFSNNAFKRQYISFRIGIAVYCNGCKLRSLFPLTIKSCFDFALFIRSNV